MTTSSTVPAAGPRRADFGAGQLLLADSRLAYAVLNHVRHRALARAFGVTPAQANLLTFVLALGMADAAWRTAGRVVHAPMHITSSDMAAGAFAVRESAIGIAGPGARQTPLIGTLLAIGVIGGLGVPGLRRAAAGLRDAERRVRAQREAQYSRARAALRRAPRA
jgi:hypothetical protein